MATSEFEQPVPPLVSENVTPPEDQDKRMRRILIWVIVGAVVLLVGLIAAIIGLMQPTTPTDRIRDVFIIVVALESLVIGVALIVLVVQLASLINL